MRRAFKPAVGIALLAGALPLVAGAAPSGSTLSLSVSPLIVEFHSDQPGVSSQSITVRNSGSLPERIVVQPVDWRTQGDGTIKIERPGAEGASSLTNALRMSPGSVVLEPGESRTLTLTMDHQPASMAAVTWGAYKIRGEMVDGQAMQFGPSADVVVYNTIGSPRGHLDLTGLRVLSGPRGAVNVEMRLLNDGVAYLRPTVHTVISQNAHVVRDDKQNIPVIFGGATRLYDRPFSDLSPGSYTLDATVDYGGATVIEGTTKFVVK